MKATCNRIARIQRQGYWDYPRRTRVGELAIELNLARATVSEHLTRISAILADEAFSALESELYLSKVISEMIKQYKLMRKIQIISTTKSLKKCGMKLNQTSRMRMKILWQRITL